MSPKQQSMYYLAGISMALLEGSLGQSLMELMYSVVLGHFASQGTQSLLIKTNSLDGSVRGRRRKEDSMGDQRNSLMCAIRGGYTLASA